MYSIKDKTMHKPKKSKDTAISSNKNFLKKKKKTGIFLNGEWKVSSNQTNFNPFKVNKDDIELS